MQVVSQGLHPARELDRVGHEVAVGVPLLLRPAVVHDDVDVARVAHSVGDHGVRGLPDENLIAVAGERVPGIPAHWGGQGQAFELIGQGDAGGERCAREET